MCWSGSPVGVGEDEAGGREMAPGPPNHPRKGRREKADSRQPWYRGKSNDDDDEA
jgi:hypothetical protein